MLNSSRKRTLKARVVDAGEGGLCVMLKRNLAMSSVVRCQFAVAGLPAGVPTLLQVRWVEEVKGEYRCGLMYLV